MFQLAAAALRILERPWRRRLGRNPAHTKDITQSSLFANYFHTWLSRWLIDPEPRRPGRAPKMRKSAGHLAGQMS
jgi:hypothetical protein